MVSPGKNILIQVSTIESAAKVHGVSVTEAREMLESAKEQLKQVRSKRPRPFLDDKIITSWYLLAFSVYGDSRVTFMPHSGML